MMVKKLFSALCLSSLLAMSACSSSDGTSDTTPESNENPDGGTDNSTLESAWRITYQLDGQVEPTALTVSFLNTGDTTRFADSNGGTGTVTQWNESGFLLTYGVGQPIKIIDIATNSNRSEGTVETPDETVPATAEPLSNNGTSTQVFDPRGDTWDLGPIDDPTAHSDATFYGDSASSGTACVHGTGVNSVGDATCTWVVTDNVNIDITCTNETGTTSISAMAFEMNFADNDPTKDNYDPSNDLAFGDYMQGVSTFTFAGPTGLTTETLGWDGRRSGGDVVACVVE